MRSYWPHGTVNVTFYGTRAGKNQLIAAICTFSFNPNFTSLYSVIF